MKKRKYWVTAMGMVLCVSIALVCYAAYHHGGDTDSDVFRVIYPNVVGTKLDSCTVCHSGGSYVDSKGKTVTLGSCQWCHYKFGYDKSGPIMETLNGYGKDYLVVQGEDAGSRIMAIENMDSDGDGYANKVEIAGLRYPGDSNDDPTKVPAPSKVYAREQLDAMPQHTQFLLMNTHKSGDFYTEYTGVAMDGLLNKLILPAATGITVYAVDGWATDHPLYPDDNPALYHVFGDYPNATFFYDQEADRAITSYGWCDYSAPSVAERSHGDAIINPKGQKLLLANKREGSDLDLAGLDSSNKLTGEGPFRVVPPQKVPGPPDQGSTNPNQDVIWPFDPTDTITDHNAGFSSKAVTMIKVLPLPEGTTDIDALEAGWPYIDAGKIVVYGSVNPVPNIKEKLAQLIAVIDRAAKSAFKQPSAQRVLQQKLEVILKQVERGNYVGALDKLQEDILAKLNGCNLSECEVPVPDKNDWVKNCDVQKQLYWAVNEIMVLLKIVA